LKVLTHRSALRVALVALALALLAFGLLSHPSTRVLAPPLPKTALRGRGITVGALRGRPAVIVFYASWCPGCHTEAPAVRQFAASAAGRGRVVAVDDDDYGNARAFVRRYHWSFPVLADPNGVASDAYGVGHLPTTVVLNSSGEIVATDPGPQTVASLDRAVRAAT
jgi:peroxiredoxin